FPYRGNIGLRYVETEQTSVGILGEQQGSSNPPTIIDPNYTINRQYADVLPSLNVAFDLTDEWVLRFAASRAVSRPDPIDLQIGLNLDIEDLDGSSGNPDLEPYNTDNFDLILEWYPEFGGAYAIGAFYKKLDSWITTGEETVSIDLGEDLGGIEDFDIDRPVNTEGGTINGLEFAFHIPFDVFSETLRGFGLQGSYTHIDAKMDSISPNTNEPIALPGTSENSANLVAYFERGRFGARMAYTYREDFLHQEGAEGFVEFTEGTEFLDLNLDWRFNDQWRLRFTANNLTDEQRYRYFVSPHLMSDIRNDGRAYILELRGSNFGKN
ncbi:MAG: TonB-dependent receptor, partial [Gammaproteobacteria bacterium]|nr:TonB-dependent receptor [Gammaproteobacteria bacterium]